jgi:hypothetical protein
MYQLCKWSFLKDALFSFSMTKKMPSVRRFGYENNPQSLILISAESLLEKISRSDELYLLVDNCHLAFPSYLQGKH